MKVLITGANGFLGKNLVAHLKVRKGVEITQFAHDEDLSRLKVLVAEADFIFHLAGVNRPQNEDEFKYGNFDLTVSLCHAIALSGKNTPIVYASSRQAALDNAYGLSKSAAEGALIDLNRSHGNSVNIFRLPNVFGKWARPNYNSVVATFCHNIANGLPIRIDDPAAKINLVYIDDVVEHFVSIMDGSAVGAVFAEVEPLYEISVGALSEQLSAFKESRNNLISEKVGEGLVRALYSTYLSYISPENFAYAIPKYSDSRGVFVEMLKTRDSGQFSFFTAHPGVTRGGHYHHSKTEKFLVIKGRACFRFRNIVSNDFYELFTEGDTPIVVETVPGWTHDITNVGEEDMVVMLWANEIFDRERPDTYPLSVVK